MDFTYILLMAVKHRGGIVMLVIVLVDTGTKELFVFI